MAALGIVRQPLYLQVKNEMIRKLSSREWKIGEAIPSETALAKQFGVSIGTIRKAVDELQDQELLIRRHGSGTYVRTFRNFSYWNRFQKFQSKDGRLIVWRSKPITLETVPAPAEVAKLLNLEAAEPVLKLVRKMYSPEYRGVDISYLKLDRFKNLEFKELDRIQGNLYRFYEENLGVFIADVQDALECRIVDEQLQEQTDLPIGEAVFYVTRVGRALNKDPLEVRFEICKASGLRIMI